MKKFFHITIIKHTSRPKTLMLDVLDARKVFKENPNLRRHPVMCNTNRTLTTLWWFVDGLSKKKIEALKTEISKGYPFPLIENFYIKKTYKTYFTKSYGKLLDKLITKKYK